MAANGNNIWPPTGTTNWPLTVAQCAGLTALPDTDVALLCDGPLAG